MGADAVRWRQGLGLEMEKGATALYAAGMNAEDEERWQKALEAERRNDEEKRKDEEKKMYEQRRKEEEKRKEEQRRREEQRRKEEARRKREEEERRKREEEERGREKRRSRDRRRRVTCLPSGATSSSGLRRKQMADLLLLRAPGWRR